MATPQYFRLYDLPTELQDIIFALANTHHSVTTGEAVEFTQKKLQILHTRLFRPALASKAFRDATRIAFLANNTFVFEGTRDPSHPNNLSNENCSITYGLYHHHDQTTDKWGRKRDDIRAGTVSDCARASGYYFTPGCCITSNFGRALKLPPPSVRSFIQHLKLVLYVPGSDCHEVSAVIDRDYTTSFRNPALDWLYPICNIHALGFPKLKLLHIELRFERQTFGWGRAIPESTAMTLKEADGDIKEWVAGQIATMALDIDKVRLEPKGWKEDE